MIMPRIRIAIIISSCIFRLCNCKEETKKDEMHQFHWIWLKAPKSDHESLNALSPAIRKQTHILFE